MKPLKYKLVQDQFSVAPSGSTKLRDCVGGSKGSTSTTETCKKDSHVALLEDKEQDTLVFWLCMTPILLFYVKLLGAITRVYFSSDQCSGQFHGRKNYARIASFHTHMGDGAVCVWNLDCSKHGKGPADGDGAVVKKAARGMEHGSNTASGGNEVRMYDSEALYKGVTKAIGFGFDEGHDWMTAEEKAARKPEKPYDPADPMAVNRRAFWFYKKGSANHKGAPDYEQAKGSTSTARSGARTRTWTSSCAGVSRAAAPRAWTSGGTSARRAHSWASGTARRASTATTGCGATSSSSAAGASARTARRRRSLARRRWSPWSKTSRRARSSP